MFVYSYFVVCMAFDIGIYKAIICSGHIYFVINGSILIPAYTAQWVERRTREHNVSGHYRLWVRILVKPEIANSLSNETLNRGSV